MSLNIYFIFVLLAHLEMSRILYCIILYCLGGGLGDGHISIGKIKYYIKTLVWYLNAKTLAQALRFFLL